MTTPTQQDRSLPDSVDTERELARKRLEMKRKFWIDVAAYIVVNAFFVLVWAMGDRGSFWPGWVLAGWGVFLMIDAYRVFLSRPITEADIDEELRRRR